MSARCATALFDGHDGAQRWAICGSHRETFQCGKAGSGGHAHPGRPWLRVPADERSRARRGDFCPFPRTQSPLAVHLLQLRQLLPPTWSHGAGRGIIPAGGGTRPAGSRQLEQPWQMLEGTQPPGRIHCRLQSCAGGRAALSACPVWSRYFTVDRGAALGRFPRIRKPLADDSAPRFFPARLAR